MTSPAQVTRCPAPRLKGMRFPGNTKVKFLLLPSSTGKMLDSDAEQPVLRPESSSTLEISNSIARLHKEYVGPRTDQRPDRDRWQTWSSACSRVATPGPSRRWMQNGGTDVVAAGRIGLQDAMRQALVSAVERSLGRCVMSFMSAKRHRAQPPERDLRADHSIKRIAKPSLVCENRSRRYDRSRSRVRFKRGPDVWLGPTGGTPVIRLAQTVVGSRFLPRVGQAVPPSPRLKPQTTFFRDDQP